MDTVMMRTTLFLVLGLACFVSTADAGPLSLASSSPVVFIDGAGDLDAMVSVVVGDTSSGFDFGHVLYDGAFVTILPDSASMTIFSAAGGDIFDFAIRDSSIGVVAAKLSDGSASMYFSGDVAAVSSAHPNVAYDYWQNLTHTLHDDAGAFLEWLGDKKPWLITKLGQIRFDKVTFRDEDVLILGNENTGLPENWHARWQDRRVFVPIPGPIRSYNLANTAAIVLAQGMLQLGNFENTE